MKKSHILKLAGAATLMLWAQGAFAKTARCDVSADGISYKGPCEFEPAGKGSFWLSRTGGRAILDYQSLSVDMDSPGVATVTAYWDGGGRSSSTSLGQVRRSTKDKACWLGSETKIKICVY